MWNQHNGGTRHEDDHQGRDKYVVETAWQDKGANWEFSETNVFDTLVEAHRCARDAHRDDRGNVTSMISKRTVLEEILAYNL